MDAFIDEVLLQMAIHIANGYTTFAAFKLIW